MNLSDERNIIIYINMYVHYPETFNSNTISNNFNNYFKEYFEANKIFDSTYNQNCYVMINSAPHSEEESLKIEICVAKKEVTSINKESAILNCKQFVTNYFNNNIKDIGVEFVSNK